MRFGFISTFPPTMCGLASFTDSLAVHLAQLNLPTSHVLQTREEGVLVPPPPVQPHAEVVGDIIHNRPSDHWKISSRLRQCDVVVLQHEFGIYGGEDGQEVLSILRSVVAPKIVVLHTVLQSPTDNQRNIIEKIGAIADHVVVMTQSAYVLLEDNYSFPMRKVSIIPHGVPHQTKSHADNDVIPGEFLTWGLIGPGKGIEWGIMALSILEERIPHARYRIIGQTHPKVFEREGNTYLEMLKRLATELGVDDRVYFENSYLPLEELGDRISRAQVVLLPYEARQQVTSGVLVEALSAGKPVVATNFPHARELINGENGIVVQHESPIHIAESLEKMMNTHNNSLFAVQDSSDLNHEHSWETVAQKFYSLAQSFAVEPVLR